MNPPTTRAHSSVSHRMRHYRTQWLDDLQALQGTLAMQWDALVVSNPTPTPFLRAAFLSALSRAGCATPETGWTPHFLLLWKRQADQSEQLAAALPLYLKHHSYGEYVFDWSWAQTWENHGQAYYPKLLCAAPFSPITGTRLLAQDDAARQALLAEVLAEARRLKVSSLHILFPDEAEQTTLQEAGLLLRSGVQFHWQNQQYAHFDAFLASLSQKKRKNIRAERRKIAEAGVQFRHLSGAEACEADWDFFYQCYANTYLERQRSPYLNRQFFQLLAATMPDTLHLIFAEQSDPHTKVRRPLAAALLMLERHADGRLVGGTAYGRYWGATASMPCLHFETAYYQAIEFCIAAGIQTLEGGAQGEHKLARGFLPVTTFSAHWLADPLFHDAVARFLVREHAGIHQYQEALLTHTPFKG